MKSSSSYVSPNGPFCQSKLTFLSVLTACLLATNVTVWGQHETTVPQNAYGRNKISLNGNWQYFVDRYEAFFYDFVRVPFDSSAIGKRDFAALDGRAKDKTDRYEYSFDGAKELKVPGDWNSQVQELLHYEGSIWYRKLFDHSDLPIENKLLLYFGAVNYRADVYVNGKKAGIHTGGFTPFAFDISELVKSGQNSLVVRVDNKRAKEAVPTDVTDWWNYGGITREVSLIKLPNVYVQDYQIQLNPENLKELLGYVELSTEYTGPVTIKSEELGLWITLDFNNQQKVSLKKRINKPFVLWSPEHPKRYDFELSVSEDRITDKIGLRTIRAEGNQLLLNEKPIFLRGICAHEENPLKGRRNTSKDDALQLFKWVKDLNANYMRLAHYPHNEHMPRLADSLGILLWEEIPVYWTIDWTNKETYHNAEKQLSDMISRDHNRSSVIIWSLANETPNTEDRLVFLKKLAKKARSLDQSRLLSAALFKQNLGDGVYTISDPFAEYTDVVSFNQYLGWYESTPEVLDNAYFKFDKAKPVIVSEFGAGAKQGFRGDSLTRWSEDYQNDLYKRTLKFLDRIPNLVGFSPWILADFRSPRRQLPIIQEGWNRKGIVGQNGTYKQAFYTLQEYYNEKNKKR
ncbi:glycoside hydrolase family 2 TIM barrel-domain containing protein [uncultured Croceitalea sp.]|uniref:glycoside hydrolase family 2 protein n=1 Tax=uncultured Croceitalea sp. TaxID=1798908 RepID=UPI003305D36F